MNEADQELLSILKSMPLKDKIALQQAMKLLMEEGRELEIVAAVKQWIERDEQTLTE